MVVEASMHIVDLRTELYRLRMPIYKVASEVSVHPSRLSLYLNGRVPMPDELRNRLEKLVEKQARSNQPDRLDV